MTRRTRRHSNIGNTFKDYLVPIIGWVVLLILLYSFFNGWDWSTSSPTNNENKNPTQISFVSWDTEAFIRYSWGNKNEKISESNSFYKGETLIVKEWIVWLQSPDGTNIKLNKIAELKYESDGSYSLYSSDAWFDIQKDTLISMKFASIEANAWSVLSLTQNEAGSTIYVLRWGAKVSNLAGASTLLVKGQKISISRLQAAKDDIDLESQRSNIDSYFKGSDWFLENQWHLILNQNDLSEEAWSWTGTTLGSQGTYVAFDSLSDEMSVSQNSLDITGTILSEEVGSITINNAQVAINQSENNFRLDGVKLWQTINDIVVKIYDNNKNTITKKVYTVYTSSRNTESSVPKNQKVTTYDVDATNFWFTAPSNTGKYSTPFGEITIRGFTNAQWISRVEVNGFKLSSFNGSTWRYHAFERFETLEEGTNQYKVDYFWEDGKIVYTDYYTIVKKPATSPKPKTKDTQEEEIISDEA